jgi:hypothetical protein
VASQSLERRIQESPLELSLVLLMFTGAPTAEVPEPLEPSLRGSPAAMLEQHSVAVGHGLPFFRTREEIRAALERGELVELPGGEDYEVADFVDPPYARPEARLFVERTAALYRQACGEPLVVTSAVRAIEEQPPNAHDLSVHPAGIAIDLRVSQNQACREWLEAKFLELEERNLVNGIRERRPPHYHVAIYPAAYTAYVQALTPPALPAGREELPGGPRSVAWIGFLLASGLVLAAVALLWWRRLKEMS